VVDVDEGVGLVRVGRNREPLPEDYLWRGLDYHLDLEPDRMGLLRLKTINVSHRRRACFQLPGRQPTAYLCCVNRGVCAGRRRWSAGGTSPWTA
jgi:hypothetical protein